MARWSRLVTYYLWIAPHILLAAVAVILYKRRLHKTFPLFFFYTLFEIVQFLLLFGIYSFLPSHGEWYQDVFVVTLAGSAALRFGVVREVFNNVFRDHARLEAMAGVAMRWLTAVLLLAAVLTAVYSSGGASDQVLAGVALLDRSAAIIQAGLLLFIFLSARAFGLPGRSLAFGIALGFGLVAVTDLGVWAVRLTDSNLVRLMNFALTGSYHIAVLIWMGYALAVEKPASAAAYSVPELDQWSTELGRSR